MRHHGNVGSGHRANCLCLIDSPFNFDARCAGLFQDPAGVVNCGLGTDLIRHERHINNDQRPFDRTRDHFGVIDHLVESHRQRRVVSLHHHAQCVADQNGIDSSRIHNAGPRVIVRRQHRQPTLLPFRGNESWHRNRCG